MKYCKRCLYPENHPLNLVIDDEGICSGCRVHEEKDIFDWRTRWKRLEAIADAYRTPGQSYDCIVPVSGGRDSYFIVHVVKNILKLKPLLVSYNKHYNTPLGIRNTAYMRIAFNCDLVERTTKPQTIRALNRATLESMGSIYWHVLAGRTAFPVKTAVHYKIPLIIWGAHQGVDQVGMFSHTEEVEMTRKYRKNHDLMGMEAEDLLRAHPKLNDLDLDTFFYPDDSDLQRVGVRGIYLNNFIRWDSKAQHERMIRNFGYETHSQAGTFDTYNDIDCHHYSGLHDRIKYAKCGYGKVTDHATREIRLKRLSRQQGLDLVKAYADHDAPDEQLFLDWQGMSHDELWELIDQHRNPLFWEKDGSTWRQKNSVLDTTDAGDITPKEECQFHITPSRAPEQDENQYMLIGKGYVHEEGPHRPPAKEWTTRTFLDEVTNNALV
ncbi:MAG: N-acetyl sugar amidotransferase [Magnetovibrio sp.]|nr:N-acetyl sugar amidotransferase [Magnetovibrio sp.]